MVYYGNVSVGGYDGPMQVIGTETFCFNMGSGNDEPKPMRGDGNNSGGGPSPNDYVPDCDGVIGSGAIWIESCKTCIGGTTGLTACPPAAYICDCDCPEEDFEMLDASLNYEPKWGQLGNKQQIKNEVK